MLPGLSNDGRSYERARDQFKTHCANIAGGYTALASVQGHWIDTAIGRAYVETMFPLHVACEPEQCAVLLDHMRYCFPDQKLFMSYVVSSEITWTDGLGRSETDMLYRNLKCPHPTYHGHGCDCD